MTVLEKHFRNVEDLAARGPQVMRKKCTDYAKTGDPFSNFRVASHVADISPARVMLALMGVKLARIENLLTAPAVYNESMEDSIMDLQNYAGILHSYLKISNEPDETYAFSGDIISDADPGDEHVPGISAAEADELAAAPYEESITAMDRLRAFLWGDTSPKV